VDAQGQAGDGGTVEALDQAVDVEREGWLHGLPVQGEMPAATLGKRD
jgi:hypothetical protein